MQEPSINKTVFEGECKGRRVIIRKMHQFAGIPTPFLPLQDYYCGYVELLPGDYYYSHLAEAESCLSVFGGITWTPEYGKLDDLPDGCFIGFDTAHANQPPFSQQTVMDDCMELIKQIIKRNEEEN